ARTGRRRGRGRPRALRPPDPPAAEAPASRAWPAHSSTLRRRARPEAARRRRAIGTCASLRSLLVWVGDRPPRSGSAEIGCFDTLKTRRRRDVLERRGLVGARERRPRWASAQAFTRPPERARPDRRPDPVRRPSRGAATGASRGVQDRGNPGIPQPIGVSYRPVKRGLLFATLLLSLGALAFVGHAASDIMRGGRLVVTPDAPPPAVDHDMFTEAVQQMGGLVLEPGNRIEVLLDGDGTFPRLWADLRAAQRSIAFQVYFCRPGAVADTLVAILEERARAGVAVHFLADGFGCNSFVEHYGDRLRAAGARVAVFRPVGWLTLHKAQHRSHARVVVVDGRIGYTGGFGIADVWHGG